jgi:hypothetical protein
MSPPPAGPTTTGSEAPGGGAGAGSVPTITVRAAAATATSSSAAASSGAMRRDEISSRMPARRGSTATGATARGSWATSRSRRAEA